MGEIVPPRGQCKHEELFNERCCEPEDDMICGPCEDRFEAAARGRWIPVTERLPDDNKNVLACTTTEVGISRYWAQCSTPHWDGDGITHWRELPGLPEVAP